MAPSRKSRQTAIRVKRLIKKIYRIRNQVNHDVYNLFWPIGFCQLQSQAKHKRSHLLADTIQKVQMVKWK